MIRRRRRTREIPFSFDSFLDIVANVVGVIIRLILVVWVGAKSYSSLKEITLPKPQAAETAAASVSLTDPLQEELNEQRRELARLQTELLIHLDGVHEAEQARLHAEGELAVMEGRRRELNRQAGSLRQDAMARAHEAETTALSLAELRQRQQQLRQQLAELERQSAPTNAVRYRTPVSQPVHAEQLMFELREGRIAFVDMAALLAEARLGLEDKAQLLRTTRQVQGVAGPAGPFRLHYTLERERGALDAIGAGAQMETNFRYGLTEWRVEPLMATRGESADQALTAGSAFRQIVDALDSRQAVVTIWVYPDSFEAYRRLRDYLHEREVVVAGRPLPAGAAIAASPRGSVSRGQ